MRCNVIKRFGKFNLILKVKALVLRVSFIILITKNETIMKLLKHCCKALR